MKWESIPAEKYRGSLFSLHENDITVTSTSVAFEATIWFLVHLQQILHFQKQVVTLKKATQCLNHEFLSRSGLSLCSYNQLDCCLDIFILLVVV